jgi:hypothetical protein
VIRMVRLPLAIEPEQWNLVFNPRASTPWLSRLPVGHFKHVLAFAWMNEARCWLIYDVQLAATRLIMLRDGPAALDLLAQITDGATVIAMKRAEQPAPWLRFGFWCVPAVKHLIGLRSSALRPDRLFRDCLRHGGKILNEPAQLPGSGRSEPAGPDASGDGQSDRGAGVAFAG